MNKFLLEAIREAEKGLSECGIPIGSILTIDNKIVAKGHNQRIQKQSTILHAEMDCLENAGRLKITDYKRAVIYTTLSPCEMCSGAILLYKIPKVVIGENINFKGPEDYLRSHGTRLEIMNNNQCIRMMKDFISLNPELWNEDIGESFTVKRTF